MRAALLALGACWTGPYMAPEQPRPPPDRARASIGDITPSCTALTLVVGKLPKWPDDSACYQETDVNGCLFATYYFDARALREWANSAIDRCADEEERR